MVNGKIMFFMFNIEGSLPAVINAWAFNGGVGAVPGTLASNAPIVSKSWI
jgi:hypothetical protein